MQLSFAKYYLQPIIVWKSNKLFVIPWLFDTACLLPLHSEPNYVYAYLSIILSIRTVCVSIARLRLTRPYGFVNATVKPTKATL